MTPGEYVTEFTDQGTKPRKPGRAGRIRRMTKSVATPEGGFQARSILDEIVHEGAQEMLKRALEELHKAIRKNYAR